MSSDDHKTSGEPTQGRNPLVDPVTRRDFLKLGAVAGAALGVGGALTGGLAACGSSSGSASASGSAAATGRTIKVGMVSPLTGPLAAFGEADKWCVDQWNAAVKGGLKCGDGQVHPVTILLRDSQSDSNRAATVAGDLITNDGVDVIMAASTADTVPPVADQAEALGVPCVTNDCPWQSYFFGRGGNPAKPFKWTYHVFWGLEALTAVFLDMWNSLQTNKKVAEMWPNDGDGIAWADPKKGQPPFLTKAGYTIVDGGRYQDGSQDFTPQIAKFKAANCDILSGVMIPPDFTSFWKESFQQGFKPVAATVGKALLFPSSLEALGSIGYGLSSECWWSPSRPYKSSLSGQTCQQMADQYEKDTGKQWTQPILHYQVFEIVADALKRATNVDDKSSILNAVVATNLQTMNGLVSWSTPALNPVPNVCTSPLAGGQWIKGTKYPFDLAVVSNSVAPEVPTTAKMQPLKY